MRLGMSVVTLSTQTHLVSLLPIVLYYHLNPSLTSPRALQSSGQGSLLWGWALLKPVGKSGKARKAISRWSSYYLWVPPFNQWVTAPSQLTETTSVLVLDGKRCFAQVSGLRRRPVWQDASCSLSINVCPRVWGDVSAKKGFRIADC